MRIKFILMIMGAIFLVASVAAFLTGDNNLRIFLSAAILSLLFFLLVYFQLRFYREGDNRQSHSGRKRFPADTPTAPAYLKSPHHRAIWEDMERTRNLMRHKEEEASRARLKEEKHEIGLPPEEKILFIADPASIYIWPAALPFLVSMLFAAGAPKALPSEASFSCLALSLLGLLILAAARFQHRYYLTNFRILIRKKFPLKKEQWSALNYPGISTISRRRWPGWEELTLKSGPKTIKISGVSKRKLEIILGILDKMGTVASVPE